MQSWKHCIRIIFLAIFIAVTFPASASEKISNFIIFGDSLSDLGNMPESNSSHTDANDLAFNTYVPFTNPVVLNNKTYSVSGQTLSFPDLSLNSLLPMQPLLDNEVRLSRSINWLQYLQQDMLQLHPEVLTAKLITPWIMLQNSTAQQYISVSYAFGSALTEDNCRDADYNNIDTNCTAATIYAAQEKYRMQGNRGVMPELQVPGVLRQIKLFQQDIAEHRVQTSADTVYIIWVGGNDIKNAYQKLLDWKHPKNIYAGLKSLYGGIGDNVNQALLQLINGNNIKAQRVIVINMYDIGLTPFAYHSWLLSHLSNYFANVYNDQLNSKVKRLQQAGINIQLYDLHALIQQFRSEDNFSKTLGEPCRTQADYLTAAANPDNCRDYIFWDNFHLTTPIHQAQAYQVMGLLVK